VCPVAHALEAVAAACGYAFVNADVGWAEFYPGPDYAAHQPEQVARVAAAWGGTGWEAGPAEAEVHFPEAIREFITLFDRGAFPDLEEGDA
jgi:truncated hemoglobin YjbI